MTRQNEHSDDDPNWPDAALVAAHRRLRARLDAETLHEALARHGLRAEREEHPRFGPKMRVYHGDHDLGWWDAAHGWAVIGLLDAGKPLMPSVLAVNQQAATELLRSLGADDVIHME